MQTYPSCKDKSFEAAPGQIAVGAERCRELVISETMFPHEPVGAVLARIAFQLREAEAEILSVFVFGAISARDEVETAMLEILGETRWPVTWVEGNGCDGAALAGLQVFAVSGAAVERISFNGKIAASVYKDGEARHCLLGGLTSTSLALTRPAQVQQTLANLQWVLGRAGFELGDVLRTWFYNDDILDWYGEFNRVRSAMYRDVVWRTGSLPASTGIGARNPAGAALILAAWAMQPLAGSSARAFEVGSPLQCPAPSYGSAFSRAVEIQSGGWRRLLVSGTASILPNGETAWEKNPLKQIELTMEVLGAILHSRAMSFDDVTRATAYFAHPLFRQYFEKWRRDHQLSRMRVVETCADVCRDELLFELELDACGRHE